MIAQAQVAESSDKSAQEIEAAKKVALAEIAKLQVHMASVAQDCESAKFAMGDQSDRDTAQIVAS